MSFGAFRKLVLEQLIHCLLFNDFPVFTNDLRDSFSILTGWFESTCSIHLLVEETAATMVSNHCLEHAFIRAGHSGVRGIFQCIAFIDLYAA